MPKATSVKMASVKQDLSSTQISSSRLPQKVSLLVDSVPGSTLDTSDSSVLRANLSVKCPVHYVWTVCTYCLNSCIILCYNVYRYCMRCLLPWFKKHGLLLDVMCK